MLFAGKIRCGPLVGDQMLVRTEGAAEGVLAQDITGMAVLQVPPQYAPVVMNINVFVPGTFQLPAAQFFKGPAGPQISQGAGHRTGPAGFVHLHGAHHAGFVQPGGQGLHISHGSGKYQRMGLSLGTAGTQQVYQHLVGSVADIQVGLHASASTSLTGGK